MLDTCSVHEFVLVHTVLVSGHESHSLLAPVVFSTSSSLFVGLQWQSLFRGARQIRTIVSKAMRSMDSRRKLNTYPKHHQNLKWDQQLLPVEYRALHSSTGRYTLHKFTPATIIIFHIRHSAAYNSSRSSLSLFKNLRELFTRSIWTIVQVVRTPSKHELLPAIRHEYARSSEANRINNNQGSEMSKPFCSVAPRPSNH